MLKKKTGIVYRFNRNLSLTDRETLYPSDSGCKTCGHRRAYRQVPEEGIVEDVHDNLLHNILFKIMEYLVKIPVSYFEICNYYIILYGKLCNIVEGTG